MRLFFLIFFIALNSFSQKTIIDNIGPVKNIYVDSVHKELFLYYKGFYNKYNLKTFKKERGELHAPPEFDISRFDFITVNKQKYLVSSGGGLVCQVNNDTVVRIDNSFDHRMQNGSNLFAYNSKIYRYGGYGFWSVRNFFIYFDRNTREWEVNNLVLSKEIPDGTFESKFILNHDDFYLFGGLKIDPYKQLERIKSDEVWRYNFKDHQWSFLGNHPVLSKGVTIKYGNKILNVVTNHIAEIDIINNKISLFEHNLISPKLNILLPSFYLDHRFYCFVKKRGKTSLKMMKEKDFLGKKLSESHFYKNSNYWWSRSIFSILMVLLLLVAGWFAVSYYKKRNKIQLLDNGVRYKNKFVEFDQESMQILKTLLSEKEVSSVKILGIVEKEQYSPAHNERLKVQKLNDINLKIKTLLGINKDLITSFKSFKDRRIRIYKIEKEYFS